MAAAEVVGKLIDKLNKGKDAEELAKAFVDAKPAQIPVELLMACVGRRDQDVGASPKAMRVLLAGRADPNAVDTTIGSPMLHNACWFGTAEVVKALLDFRADPEAHDRMKMPALNTALAAGNAPACLELLNRNCDVMWQHHDGATALHVATAWIASSHNSQMRLPPFGEEPRAVIAMMLHNGIDPTQREGETRKNSSRSLGMTPLESFRREIARSPWREHPDTREKFFHMSQVVHKILEQGEEAVKEKNSGNKAFGESRYEDAIKLYSSARKMWAAADIRGHHTAVLFSNEAACHRRLEQWDKCKDACAEGQTHFCSAKIRKKLEDLQSEAEKELADIAAGVVKEKPEKPQVPRNPPTKLKEGWVEETEKEPLYPAEGSVQGKVEKPGPFICNFNDAKEAGFVDGVDGWKDRQKREEQELDKELVAEGLMSPDLLDDPKSVQYINPLPPGTG